MVLVDILQHQQIKKARSASSRAAVSAEATRVGQADAALAIKNLERNVEHLTMLTGVLWELLGEHAGITEDQFNQKISEVSRRLENPQAHQALPMVDCPCGAKIGAHASNCDFCGQPR